jgi:GDPmannose 4,6-dehydratase
MQWLILQQDEPEDYRARHRESNSRCATSSLDLPRLGRAASSGAGRASWRSASDKAPGKTLVRSTRLFPPRPRSIDLLGDPSKAREKLGWRAKITFPQLAPKWWRAISSPGAMPSGADHGLHGV